MRPVTQTAFRSRRASRARDDRGVALVEFALIAPILFVVLFAILDFGRVINYWIDATHLSAEGARFAVVNRNPGGSGTSLQQYIQGQGDTSELRSGGSSTGVTSPLQVCISFPNGTTVGDPVKVTSQFSFNWIPILNLGTSTVSADATMRLEAPPSNYSAGCS